MKNRILSLMATLVLVLSTFAANIETDRNWYLAGEAMKISVTADNALIAYAELCDTHGLAAGVVVSIKGGKGTGMIELPSSLHSGYYVLSVYTRHSTQVFQRLIAIVNPLHKSGDDDIEWVLGDGCWVEDQPPVPLILKDVDVRETEGHIIKARVKNVYDGNTFKGSEISPSM